MLHMVVVSTGAPPAGPPPPATSPETPCGLGQFWWGSQTDPDWAAYAYSFQVRPWLECEPV